MIYVIEKADLDLEVCMPKPIYTNALSYKELAGINFTLQDLRKIDYVLHYVSRYKNSVCEIELNNFLHGKLIYPRFCFEKELDFEFEPKAHIRSFLNLKSKQNFKKIRRVFVDNVLIAEQKSLNADLQTTGRGYNAHTRRLFTQDF